MTTVAELDAALEEARGAESFASTSDFVAWMRFRLPAFAAAPKPTAASPVATRFNGCRDPLWMRPGTSDGDVAAQIFLRGEYAFLATLTLSPNPIVVDLGANIGAFIQFADSLWPDASFVAVEPERGNVEVLRANTDTLVHQGRLRLFEACVGAAAGLASLDTSGGAWAVRMNPLDEGGNVRVITMTELLGQASIDQIDLLKCDIEGAEAQVFSACKPWIGAVRNLVVEVHDPYGREDLEHDLARAGSLLRWRATTVQPPGVVPPNSTHLFSI